MLRAIDSGVVSRVDEEGIRQEEHELREKIRQLEVQLYTTQVELCRASTPATQGAHPQSSSRDDPNDPLHGLTAAEWQKTGDALVELTLENQKLKADNHTLHLRIAQLETGLLEGGRKKRRTTTQVLAAGERSDSRIVAETAGGAAAAGAAGAAVHVTPASNPTAAPTQLTPGQNPYIAVPTGHYNQFTRSTAMTLPGWTQPKGGQILDLTQDHSMQSTQNVQETLSQEDLLNLAQNDPDFLRQLPQRDLDVLMETVQNTPNAYEESGICTLIIGALARNQENAQSGEQEERSDGHL
ncbi:hypothetical protein BJY04DRAFT_200818 [Aspergillus karnatakaensis]|uniref:uncharacterized protein n=1 Tax=Aspergillus karnatakaensis TaxID=1810916 RepID=UPI003CCCC307